MAFGGLAADHAVVAGHGAGILQPVDQLQQAAEVRHRRGDGSGGGEGRGVPHGESSLD